MPTSLSFKGTILFRKVQKICNIFSFQNAEQNLVRTIQFIEQETRLDRGKGDKTKSIIQIKEVSMRAFANNI